MKAIDPGHLYALDSLDALDAHEREVLRFVKRVGPNYPGNVDPHSGTNAQEVLRALIHRMEFLDGQIHDAANLEVIRHLREAIWFLEERAARRHGRPFPFGFVGIERQPTCAKCFHVGCKGECRPDKELPEAAKRIAEKRKGLSRELAKDD